MIKKTNILLSVLVGFAFLLIFCIQSSAQTDKSSSSKIWMTIGMGPASGPYELAVSYLGGINLQRGKSLYTARYTISDALDASSTLKEVSLLYGYSLPFEKVHLSLSLGPAFTIESDCEICSEAFGLAVGSQIFYKFPRIGFGTYLFGSFNKFDNYVGATLTINIGKLE